MFFWGVGGGIRFAFRFTFRFVGDRPGTTKKHFAEHSDELSGAICPQTFVILGNDPVAPSNCSENSLVLFVQFIGFVSPYWLLILEFKYVRGNFVLQRRHLKTYNKTITISNSARGVPRIFSDRKCMIEVFLSSKLRRADTQTPTG